MNLTAFESGGRLNPELQQYADGIRELVSEIRSFAEIARDASSPDSGAYLEVFSVVSDLARSLERQYGRNRCLHVVAWHVLASSTAWDMEDGKEFELDFSGKDNIYNKLKDILKKLRASKK
ncbi:MAG: hypothetical protein A2418_01240 [Candidatus Brennerbacteria bacterium RIFOXYC1_FULL_41_11]|uniref:Uncharacterized protein n=1 Tax=Candidatus Brennerbacteria bacterium RIFOXYD1_FULL_41_16 TaxID=1797529 RepID=A0A1G1XKK1_9BACT|nr:MAG: hypothetical protein A2391_00010 [Candidatus Brennerbacteria bacterium RIFOXYB1_FULL_41_13]OGY39199.1 MAG: hypothetical protein A2418_01240 [Candidatus Brennerbacteria bacterium RIFOXYC1_FULL_41_11]OGY40481.1 MAG: hypothetical protein A2570_01900 [Candidatus Brennerbacteria bacterium RIFOXYD1_FULL_41_16]